MKFNVVYIGLMILGLTACSSYQQVTELMPRVANNESSNRCLAGLSTKVWVNAFLLSPEQRAEALNTVEQPEGIEQVSLRAMLLTHSDASYRDLREAEDLILNQLPLNTQEEGDCESDELIDFILKLNQTLQKRKSEVVLLQRQIDEQNKTIEIQSTENAELEKKIEALTNIEHRMKTRAKSIDAEVVR